MPRGPVRTAAQEEALFVRTVSFRRRSTVDRYPRVDWSTEHLNSTDGRSAIEQFEC